MRRVLIIIAIVVLAGCTHAAKVDTGLPFLPAAPPRLVAFTSCSDLLATVKSEAEREVGQYGLAYGQGYGLGYERKAAFAAGGVESAAATPAAAGAADNAAPAPGFSTTNDQEVGVDEPDVAKTDGTRLVSLRGGNVLQVTDVSGSRLVLRGSTTLPSPASGLFLVGPYAVVLGDVYDAVQTAGPQTAVWVVNLADPDHPAVIRSYTVSGSEVDARLIGHDIKLVVTNQPRLAYPSVMPGGDAAAAERSAIAASSVADWLPTVTDANGDTHPTACQAVDHTDQSSGVGMVSVVSINPDNAVPSPAVTVLGNPGTVYASATHLYVATSPFAVQQSISEGDAATNPTTTIHDFDISGSGSATYVGSGSVPGVVLNQYALSEYKGDLRVATTTGVPTPPPGEGGPVPAGDGSQSFVTVLRPSAGGLLAVGQVGGLGQGQRIYGVRFVGAQGYVVTYRQLDPLYVVDLSDPAHPAVKGALELTGYSAYLQPVGDGRLLGIGTSSDANAHRTGAQISLFDIGDPSHPSLAGQDQLPGGQVAVEQDPHAFLWWAPAGLAFVPANQYGSDGVPFSGVVVVKVDASGLHEAGRLSQPASPPPGIYRSAPATPMPMPVMVSSGIERAIVVGDRVITVSEAGVMASNLTTFAQQAWAPYPAS